MMWKGLFASSLFIGEGLDDKHGADACLPEELEDGLRPELSCGL